MSALDAWSESLLRLAADGDRQTPEAQRARVAAGEPAAYVVGFTVFAGRRFRIDQRAFITDPETEYLTDAVLDHGRRLQRQLGRAPRVLEFGIGAGTLAITVKLAEPDWIVAGLDVDAGALSLAAENAQQHGVEVKLVESDYFDAWPADSSAPDLIFGDPPWGSASDLYDAHRDEHYYRQMPAASAFPPGGQRTAIHDQLLRRVTALEWPSLLLLNYGTLPLDVIARSAAPLREWHLLHPQPGLSVLVGRGRQGP
jgi:methylase of polypeptide subunit release factors